MNNLVIQEYICANSKITQNYFTFVDRILDLLHETPQKREILERLLSQTEEITNKFLETNQQLLSFSSNQSIILEEFDENLVKASISENQQNHEPKNIHQKIHDNQLDPQEWLRNTLAKMTGYETDHINLSLDFFSLGLDSLSILDLHEALNQQYPLINKFYQYDEVDTPQKLLNIIYSFSENPKKNELYTVDIEEVISNIISDLTGFSEDNIDMTVSFDELGLDSLGRLDFLEALQLKCPSVKKYDGNIMDLLELSPKEISNTLKKFFNENKPSPTSKLKESLFLLLEKHSAIDNFNEETPFSEYLADGFIRAQIWEEMGNQFSHCKFAGEALMSRRNAKEALALLTDLES